MSNIKWVLLKNVERSLPIDFFFIQDLHIFEAQTHLKKAWCMDNEKTIQLELLPCPGNSNVTFMKIKTESRSYTALLSHADAIALQTSGLLNLIFSNEKDKTLING